MNSETRVCQNCKNQFVIEPEDFAFYEKIKVPPPTFCSRCRVQRRMLWRNEWKLFRRPDALDGKEIFSNFPKEANVKVYTKEYWWSDNWDAMDYGRDYDFSRPFFEQLQGLLADVPLSSRALIGDIVNSDYAMNAGHLKDCYMTFNMNYAEDLMYMVGGTRNKKCMDSHLLNASEACYESVNLTQCYKTFYSVDCSDCNDVLFSRDCVGCGNCFGCVGLRGKSYCVFNKQYTREDYQKFIADAKLDSWSSIQDYMKQAQDFWNTVPAKYHKGRKNVNSTGEYIFNSSNVQDSYRVLGGENLRYCQNIINGPAKDSYDQTGWGNNSELVYEAVQSGEGVSNVKFCFGVYGDVSDIQYSIYCHGSSKLFGCIGLRKKQYCILNKQYSKEEYEALLPKVIDHMNAMPYVDAQGRVYKYGEFFPSALSPFAYNQTIAVEYVPLSQAEAQAQGFRWAEPQVGTYTVSQSALDLPDSFEDVSEAIVNDIIGCSHNGTCTHGCTKAYRILPHELQFYKEFNIPLPRTCFNCRHNRRMQFRNPLELTERVCQCFGAGSEKGNYLNTVRHFHGDGKCPHIFKTSYASSRPEIVYCEECYNAEIV